MSEQIEPAPASNGPVRYQIQVKGELGASWSDWFTGLRVVAEHGDTLLVGRMDQAALHATLRRVRDLGLPLVAVSRLEDR